MRARHELLHYRHEQLMHDLNEFHIRIKVHLYNIGDLQFKYRHPKPSVQEMDEMLNRVLEVLREDSSPMRKY